jgi:hypothetical protein
VTSFRKTNCGKLAAMTFEALHVVTPTSLK